jgi:hypothetical protein
MAEYTNLRRHCSMQCGDGSDEWVGALWRNEGGDPHFLVIQHRQYHQVVESKLRVACRKLHGVCTTNGNSRRRCDDFAGM